MKRKFRLTLTNDQRTQLTALIHEPGVRRGTRLRAQILLNAATRASDRSIAGAFGVSLLTVSQIRQRFVEAGLEAALGQRHGPGSCTGRKSLLDDHAEAQLVALARSAPPAGRTSWSAQLLADALIECGIVESIANTTVRYTLRRHGVRLKGTHGRRRKLDSAQAATLVDLAQSAPPAGHNHWTSQQLANALVARGIVESISAETVWSTLRRMAPDLIRGRHRGL